MKKNMVKEKMRVVVCVDKDEYLMGTVTEIDTKSVTVLFDDGDEGDVKFSDILGEGIKKKYKKSFSKEDSDSFLIDTDDTEDDDDKKTKKDKSKKDKTKKDDNEESGRGSGIKKKNISFKGQTGTIESLFGKSPLSAGELMKKIWAFINKNNLKK